MTIPQVTCPVYFRCFHDGVMCCRYGLPLHIFEPRYRAMVEDASRPIKFSYDPAVRAGGRQPGPQPDAAAQLPPLQVGCAGHIEKFERFPDGRFSFSSKACIDFASSASRARSRLSPCEAIYQDFPDKTAAEGWNCRARRAPSVGSFRQSPWHARQTEQAEKFSDLELINLLGVSLPFHPA